MENQKSKGPVTFCCGFMEHKSVLFIRNGHWTFSKSIYLGNQNWSCLKLNLQRENQAIHKLGFCFDQETL